MSSHERLVELLRDVNRSMGKSVREILNEDGIPFSMMVIIKNLRMVPGITTSELSRRTGIAKSHVSNIIRQLNAKGWVEKRTDAADQRILRLYLAPTANAEMQTLGGKIRAQLNTLVADLPEERVVQLIEGLSELKAILDKKSADCSAPEGHD